MVETHQALAQLYPAPTERALRKQLAALDRHCQRFIALSPFVVLATSGSTGGLDASPRGGPPGFVQVANPNLLRIADAPGNRRLDSLHNIIDSGRIGLLFMIPGVDETLRVNGRAWLNDDSALCAALADAKRRPPLVIEVAVEEAYLHCAKAFLRSRLWQAEAQQPRSCLPTSGEMINDQTGLNSPLETQAEMVARYQVDL